MNFQERLEELKRLNNEIIMLKEKKKKLDRIFILFFLFLFLLALCLLNFNTLRGFIYG